MRLFLRRFGKTLFIVALVLAVSLGVALSVSRYFDVKNIEVVGAHLAVGIDQRKLDKNLLFFPTQKVRAQILADNPMLKDVQIQKKFPHTLVIVAYQRTPIARLSAGDYEVVIDADGFVVGLAGMSDKSLPLIAIPTNSTAVGVQTTDPIIKFALVFIAGVGDIKVISIRQLDSASLSAKIGETDIYFTQGNDIQNKVTTLQRIIAGFRIKGTLPKVIDLRFDKPIVTF